MLAGFPLQAMEFRTDQAARSGFVSFDIVTEIVLDQQTTPELFRAAVKLGATTEGDDPKQTARLAVALSDRFQEDASSGSDILEEVVGDVRYAVHTRRGKQTLQLQLVDAGGLTEPVEVDNRVFNVIDGAVIGTSRVEAEGKVDVGLGETLEGLQIWGTVPGLDALDGVESPVLTLLDPSEIGLQDLSIADFGLSGTWPDARISLTGVAEGITVLSLVFPGDRDTVPGVKPDLLVTVAEPLSKYKMAFAGFTVDRTVVDRTQTSVIGDEMNVEQETLVTPVGTQLFDLPGAFTGTTYRSVSPAATFVATLDRLKDPTMFRRIEITTPGAAGRSRERAPPGRRRPPAHAEGPDHQRHHPPRSLRLPLLAPVRGGERPLSRRRRRQGDLPHRVPLAHLRTRRLPADRDQGALTRGRALRARGFPRPLVTPPLRGRWVRPPRGPGGLRGRRTPWVVVGRRGRNSRMARGVVSMGFTTVFFGSVEIAPPLSRTEVAYLRRFAGTRRMASTLGPYHVDRPGDPGQDTGSVVLDANRPAEGQPGLWCQWIPGEDGSKLLWDGGEKFYEPVDWMRYLIEHFLRHGARAQQSGDPQFRDFTFDHVVDGTIAAACQPEGGMFILYRIEVEQNRVDVVEFEVPTIQDVELLEELEEEGLLDLLDALGRTGEPRETVIRGLLARVEARVQKALLRAIKGIAPQLPDGEDLASFLTWDLDS